MPFRYMLVGAALLLASVLLVVRGQSSQAQQVLDYTDYREVMVRLVGEAADNRQFNGLSTGVVRGIAETGDSLYIAPLIDVGYFMRSNGPFTDALYAALVELTGRDDFTTWPEWFEWASAEDIALPPDYAEFKGLMLSIFVDPEFARFFEPDVQDTARVNMIEAVWGGVRVDGIPSLVNARQITPQAAMEEGESLTQFCNNGDCAYPAANELVFGVEIDGDARAYPLRLLNWHEMFNDVIGHTPMLDAPGGEQVCNFRAPTEFSALGYDGDFVLVNGYSAGCAEEGWLSVDDLEWSDGNWETVRAQLPALAAEETALGAEDGVAGRVIGRPVMLAYCTLCGSGILYDATIPDLSYTDANGDLVELGETVLEFGSTGMLMRSNKLMYDRTTDTVWNALTGEPAFGPLATSDVVLDLLPVVVTDWATWLEEHPDTSVLSLETGFRRDYTNGAAYSDYFNDPNFIMFPVFNTDDAEVENKDMVFGLRLSGEVKAYPLEALIEEGVSNDRLGETDVVIVTRATPGREFFEPGGAAVRAYESNGLAFSTGEDAGEVVDENGVVWQVTEDALVSADGDTLERLPGHLAFWFGWLSFHPDTQIYEI